MKKRLLPILTSLLIIFLAACSDDTPETSQTTTTPTEHSRTEILMNTPVSIRLFDIDCTDGNDEPRCSLLDEAFEFLRDAERRWTVNDVGGEVERINEMAGIEPVAVAPDTFYLIDAAIHYSIMSNRAFNATIGPLTNLWSIGMEGANRPDDEAIQDILPLLDPTLVTLDSEALTVFLQEPGMRLDLGAIAKGYMGDLVRDMLVEGGIERALLIIGGEVIAIGGRSDGTPFRVGISAPHPEISGGDIVGTVSAFNQAVVTSGTYRRYLAHQDTRTVYHHIFDSFTGFPFETDIVVLSIIADDGLIGEIYTTVVFAMGIEQGIAFINSLPHIEGLIISRDNGVYLSNGLIHDFHLILDETFEIR